LNAHLELKVTKTGTHSELLKSIYPPWNLVDPWANAQEAKFMPFDKKKEKPKPEHKKPEKK